MPLTGNLSEKAGPAGSSLMYFFLQHLMDADIIPCNTGFMADLERNKQHAEKVNLCVVREERAS